MWVTLVPRNVSDNEDYGRINGFSVSSVVVNSAGRWCLDVGSSVTGGAHRRVDRFPRGGLDRDIHPERTRPRVPSLVRGVKHWRGPQMVPASSTYIFSLAAWPRWSWKHEYAVTRAGDSTHAATAHDISTMYTPVHTPISSLHCVLMHVDDLNMAWEERGAIISVDASFGLSGPDRLLYSDCRLCELLGAAVARGLSIYTRWSFGA